uniref:Morc S5 domain-containing protein n=1 Tax=Gossypium raimondii TaxID=29730 RepID=A0A0D2QL44_GOSRA|nr:hypothetical protein B456_001G055900 [Gossypium raimondii]
MDVLVKKEIIETINARKRKLNDVARKHLESVIQLSSSSSDSDSNDDSDGPDENINANTTIAAVDRPEGRIRKKRKVNDVDFQLPMGFLSTLPPDDPIPAQLDSVTAVAGGAETAGAEYDGVSSTDCDLPSGGMDHVRVHPKFLHSNATSHKWALGAFAELLDNSLDEVCNGATYVNMDMLKCKKDGNQMLLIEDNGGGMDPDKMRQCMSLGYSAKSKVANAIGQYGNGFKTSTMRLGADVIVFSRCRGKDGKHPTQSIGLLSYTFLTSTGKEDIVVPMLDYEWRQEEWSKIIRSTDGDWYRNLDTIVEWSPFSSVQKSSISFANFRFVLLSWDLHYASHSCIFNLMKDQGTQIIIYNLWEDDQGLLELDFLGDPHDIQLRGVNCDETNIQMAKQFPNSRHFLTYKHSLRSYASILYLRLPPNFRIILRGKDVEHHDIVNDMMLTDRVTYRPNPSAEGAPKDLHLSAMVIIGFVKDAKHHIDVQGFNVYHKNRLVKPFWRVWNSSGSDGRGVLGVLEANFVEPAHDKQGFERTTVLARLEARLVQMQKAYWSINCHRIGYAPRRNKKNINQSLAKDTSPGRDPKISTRLNKNGTSSTSSSNRLSSDSDKSNSPSSWRKRGKESLGFRETVDRGYGNGHLFNKGDYNKKLLIDKGRKDMPKSGKGSSPSRLSFHLAEDATIDVYEVLPERQANVSSQKFVIDRGLNDGEPSLSEANLHILEQLTQENCELKKRLEKYEGAHQSELLNDLQKERSQCKSLEIELTAAQEKIDNLSIEHESLIHIFSEERDRRNKEEENLRKKLKEASNTIQELLDKIKLLEKMKSPVLR